MTILPRVQSNHNFLRTSENTEFISPEHTAVVTDEHASGEPRVRGKISSATSTRCDINSIVGMCMLAVQRSSFKSRLHLKLMMNLAECMFIKMSLNSGKCSTMNLFQCYYSK